ncbi:MAG: PfkB family carbohydrate kinase [Deltaproteobacteria bacterium]
MRQTSDKKIKSFDELNSILKREKQDNKKIILCHGVFDLLHSGHLFHFRSAKQYGDVLVVSVTPDHLVNKGPDRPYFNENIRMRNIAEVESVDYVVLNKWPTAVETLFKINPDIYAKGRDYVNPDEDVTKNIQRERAAIEEMGGKIIFTDEPSMSSSNLLNEYFSGYSEEVKKFLTDFKKRHSVSEVLENVDKISQLRVLLIGEAIVDRYTYCFPLAKSTKETMLATKRLTEEDFLGGALAIANHISNFCRSVTLITHTDASEDETFDFIGSHLNNNVQLKNVSMVDRKTIIKQRFVEPSFLTKMFEVQDLDDTPLPVQAEKNFLSLIEQNAEAHDLIVIADYGHGFITQNIIDSLVRKEHYLCINAQTNSANLGHNLITRYPKANFICIDEVELRLATNMKHSSIEEMIGLLRKKINLSTVLVSRGAKGVVINAEEGCHYSVPVFSNKVVDRTGAGDAVFSLTALLIFSKCPVPILGLIANCAGALKVNSVCNRVSIDPVALKKFVTALLA